jgi:hypothetical protein
MSINRNRLAFCTAVILLSVAPASRADTAPPEIARTVKAFAGGWTLDGTQLTPDGQSEKGKLLVDCQQAALGKGVACTMRGQFPKSGAWEGRFLIGYDTFSRRVHVMSLTSDESVHDHMCGWQGETLMCDPLKGGSGGQPVTEDLSFTVGPRTMTLKVVVALKDGGRVLFDATGKRR